MTRAYGAVLPILAGLLVAPATAAAAGVMALEAKIPLSAVRGRIDHLAVDVARQRLFVAELGNGSLGVVDLAQDRLLTRITGLDEPQGVAFAASADAVYVTSGGDGSLRRFAGADLAAVSSSALGEDADNLRIDAGAGQVVAGYGHGALALIDAATGDKMGDIALPGHPESFQLETNGKRIFVNVPEAGRVVVVDRATGRELASWDPGGHGNFAMALDEASGRLLVVDRRPPALVVLDTRDGHQVARLPTCGDADDVFLDPRRQRAYVACGEGFLAIVQRRGDIYAELARVPTAAGARTALFMPELDRVFLAVPASGKKAAAIWVYGPQPP